jgi:hypothetical protein
MLLHGTSNNRGEATMTAKQRAREMAFQLSLRGMSSAYGAAIEISTMAASCPSHLSTVPTRASRKDALEFEASPLTLSASRRRQPL